jgi:energy-coupling factor transport system ATP-binding protein
VEAEEMRVVLDSARIKRGDWVLAANAIFSEGIHLVTGKIGSGKSTLAMLMAGILLPEEGNIACEGISTRMLSMQFPEYHITGSTVTSEIASWGIDVPAVLEASGLIGRGGEDPFRLSRGELKRLHLACILAREWDLLLLDEPFSSLDHAGKSWVCRKIEARRSGITIFFTHEQWVLPRVHHLWMMDPPGIQYLGRIPEAIPRWSSPPPYIRRLLERGGTPDNVTLEDALEAECRIPD